MMSSGGSRKKRPRSKEELSSTLPTTEDSYTSNSHSSEPTAQQQPPQSDIEHKATQPGGEEQPETDSKTAEAPHKPPLASLFDCLFACQHTELSGPTAQNLEGCSSGLLHAVSWKNHDLAKSLLEKGADVTQVSESGQNCLMIAASNGDVTMLNTIWPFRGNSLDINASDKDGNTALTLCTQAACTDGVTFLLLHGADVNVKNKMGQTPLHLAAKVGNEELCYVIIRSMTHEEHVENELPRTVRGILCEDQAGRTPLCEALRYHHLLVVKILLIFCSKEEAVEFYMSRMRLMKSLPPSGVGREAESINEFHCIIGTLLLVIQKLHRCHMVELAGADPVTCLLHVIRNKSDSIKVLSTACLMISELIFEDCPEDNEDQLKVKEPIDKVINQNIRDELLKQFLDCRGPHLVMEKLSSHVYGAHDTYYIVYTLLPVIILASRAAGKAWLEQNSGNLSFFKELLTRKKINYTVPPTKFNFRSQLKHRARVMHLIKEFLTFVEGIEAKDREQNLAELLEEEERERIKREKKKRKRQKKHSKHAKPEVPQVIVTAASTDEETEAVESRTWSSENNRKGSDLIASRSLEANSSQPDPPSQLAPTLRLSQTREIHGVAKKLLVSVPVEITPDKKPKWVRSATASKEFPPISAGSDDRMSADANDGWVKVEGRKPSSRGAIKPITTCLANPNLLKTQEFTKLAPMRWADVAKIGCSNNPGTRNFTVLIGDVSRSVNTDYFKMSSLNKSTELLNSDELIRRTEDRNSDWQQIARNAFVDSMSSKDRDPDQILTVEDASSDSDSEDLSSTTSSECRSGMSCDLKNSISVAGDFSGIDASMSKSVCKNREFPSFACTFSESREHKLFPNDDASCFDLCNRSFIGQKFLYEVAATNDKNHHRKDEKTCDDGTAWTWLKERSISFPTARNDAPSRTLEILNSSCAAEKKSHFLRRGAQADPQNAGARLISPPFSARDTFCDLLPELSLSSTRLQQLQKCKEKLEAGKLASIETLFQKKSVSDQQQTLETWQSPQQMQGDVTQWTENKEARVKPVACKLGSAWNSLFTSMEQQTVTSSSAAVNSFMPSFASMNNAVDNNPIVTSMVESVLTPILTPLTSVCRDSKISGASDIPSPPPGFQPQKPNPLGAFALDRTLALLSSQNVFSRTQFVQSTDRASQEYELSRIAVTSSGQLSGMVSSSASQSAEYDARQLDKYGVTTSRSPMVGIVGPFSKMTKPSDDQQQQASRPQRSSTKFGSISTCPSFSSVVSSCSTPRTAVTQSVLGMPINTVQRIPASTSAGSHITWSERVAQSLNCTSSYPLLSTTPSSVPSLLDFSILASQPQARTTSRILDSQSNLLKRAADNQLRTLQEAMDSYQRRQTEQLLFHQQLKERHQQQQCLGASQMCKSSKGRSTLQQQPKSYLNLMQQRQHQLRFLQQAQMSPPVLFPSDLREEVEPRPADKPIFTGFHEAVSSDLLSDLFSDPLLIERIAINQIRQQFLTQQANSLLRDTATGALRESVYGNDLDYYASMYRVKLKDILGGPPWHGDSVVDAFLNGNRGDPDRHPISASRIPSNQEGHCLSSDAVQEKPSRRWRNAINRILDTPWTMRRQYGDIVLPSSQAEYTVSHVEFPLVLGLTTEGHEIAILVLDKSQAYIDPCLLDLMCNPDLDHHFILKCKGMCETCITEYVALELCDYTLSEYMQIVLLSHRQDPLSANRLSWQLLEGLKFVHHHLCMPHGFLKPSWIFVDSEGRLRLGGCGIVTKQSSHIMGSSCLDRSYTAQSACWTSSEDLNNDHPRPSMASDIQVAGMLLYFILTGGQHPFGATPLEVELNIARNISQLQHISEEANDLVSGMLFPDPSARPTIEHCLKHPFFWSSEKKFRLILIVGSDVLTEMKTGIALTGNGSPTMMEILGVIDISEVSPNWVQAINPTVMKEMRSFRVYKNNLSELTLFIYNCCLHFDKMSTAAKEVLDDPCKYFLSLFPSLFMAIYRSLKVSDRTERTCYKPFF